MTNLRSETILRAENGRLIAAAIDDAVVAYLPDDLDLLTVVAHRVRTCNSDHNTWFGKDLHTATGEAFDGSGRFWHCGSKLCPECLAKTSRRNRKNLSGIINNQKLLVGEHYHFLTLTMPNQGLPLLQARSIMNHAWSVFRKKKWFVRTMIGGVKSEEFTLTKTGYHYHMHSIARSRYINYHDFRHYWTEALRYAFECAGLTLTVATMDKMAMANCQRIGSVSEAVKEVGKYITKTSTWRKLRPADLLDIARIRRWPRMFEFFGTFRAVPEGVADPAGLDSVNKTILDKNELSDGEEDPSWRGEIRRLGVAQYLEKFHDQVNDQSRVRMQQLKFHYGAAKFWRLPQKIPPDIDAITRRLSKLHERRGEPERIVQWQRKRADGKLIDVFADRSQTN